MGFKFDSDPDHVNKFRAVVAFARDLDQKVDTNQLTPDQAWKALQDYIDDNPLPAQSPNVKKLQDEEKAASEKAAKAEAAEAKKETKVTHG